MTISMSAHAIAGGGSYASFDLSSLNGLAGFVIHGVDPGDACGAAVAGIGDVNGDGVDDFAIGAESADPNGDSSGECYIIFGSASIGTGGVLELSSLAGIDGVVIEGAAPDDRLGASVSGAGDVNDDGYGDLIVGAPDKPREGIDAGRAYVVFGGPQIGTNGALEVRSLDGTNGFALVGVDIDDLCGLSVSRAGDFNDDGVDDLIIGALAAAGNGDESGESYLVFGLTGIGAGGVLQLSLLDGSDGFRILGAEADD